MSAGTTMIQEPFTKTPPRTMNPALLSAEPATAAVAIPASGSMTPGDREALRGMLAEWTEEDQLGDPEEQERSWALLSRLLEEDRP